jgi:hypothetical protein
VIEDAIAHREFALTGEALHCSSFLRIEKFKRRLKAYRSDVRWQMNS